MPRTAQPNVIPVAQLLCLSLREVRAMAGVSRRHAQLARTARVLRHKRRLQRLAARGRLALHNLSDTSFALLGDGSLFAWGSYDVVRACKPRDAGYVAVANGVSHCVALRHDGRVVTWGDTRWQQCNDTPTNSGYVSIACGGRQSAALHGDGRVVVWGNSRACADAPSGAGYVAVACGKKHGLTLWGDGRVVSWGSNGLNQRSETPRTPATWRFCVDPTTVSRCATTAASSPGARACAVRSATRLQTTGTFRSRVGVT